MVQNDCLNNIVNAERRGKRQVLIRPSSKVVLKFLSVMQRHGEHLLFSSMFALLLHRSITTIAALFIIRVLRFKSPKDGSTPCLRSTIQRVFYPCHGHEFTKETTFSISFLSNNLVKDIPLTFCHFPSSGYIGEFEIVDDHRPNKIFIQLNARLNKTGVISPRFNIQHSQIESWVNLLLPARGFGIIILVCLFFCPRWLCVRFLWFL